MMLSPPMLVAGLCLVEILALLAATTFPALLPTFLAEWRMSNTEAGWISGIYYGGYVAAVPVLTGLTDRMDARRILFFALGRSEEHTSELQSLMRISYAVFCLKKKIKTTIFITPSITILPTICLK